MEILYVMVIISLTVSLAFLRIFFWAVDNGQMESIDDVSLTILDDDEGRGLSNE